MRSQFSQTHNDYAFALRKNLIRCDVDAIEGFAIEPHREPTATFISPTVGYREGSPASGPLNFDVSLADRHAYYEEMHIETIKFQIARLIVQQLAALAHEGKEARARAFRLQSRHQLFPQVYAIVTTTCAGRWTSRARIRVNSDWKLMSSAWLYVSAMPSTPMKLRVSHR